MLLLSLLQGRHSALRLATAVSSASKARSTLPHDRVDKASLYAQAGVADYWIVDLEERQLEVYRISAPDAAQPFGFGYTDVQTYRMGQSIAPVAAPDAPVAVADLLP